MKCFSLVVIASKNLGIGKDGALLKRIPADMANFKTLTTIGTGLNTVIMGRRTWESIPQNFKPLKDRKNIVISSNLSVQDATVCNTFSEALNMGEGNVFVIGGAKVFQEAMSAQFVSLCKHIYLTRIAVELDADTFLPASAKHLYSPNLFGPMFKLTDVSKSYSSDGTPYDFTVYSNVNYSEAPLIKYPVHEENQYLNLIQTLIKNGTVREDRTKIGTISLFGAQQRWDLSECFPVLTTKTVFWKGVVEELLWFIRGDTDSRHLSEKGVSIWDGNGSRDFLDARGLTDREEGDLGPVYGFQWRHFGTKYQNCHSDYQGQGVDQLREVINLIKTDPYSRRILMSAWNPSDLDQMALPPCHITCQFYVSEGKLSCQMYQRSCDIGLGVPFNISSYALLTCLIAQVCDLRPGEFVHTMGDAHVYSTHVDALTQQLTRMPHTFPVLKLNPAIRDIEEFTSTDISLIGYNSHPRIKMEMAL